MIQSGLLYPTYMNPLKNEEWNWEKNACPATNQANHVFVCIYTTPLTQWMIRIPVCGSIATTLRQSYALKYSKLIQFLQPSPTLTPLKKNTLI